MNAAGPEVVGPKARPPRRRSWGLAIVRTRVASQLWLDGAILAVMVAGLLLLRHTEPSPRGVGTHEQWGLPPCTFHYLLGVPCLTCGLTTGLAWMARGQVVAAAQANLLSVPLFLLGGWLTVQSVLSLGLRRRVVVFFPARLEKWLWIVGIAIALLDWGLRIAAALGGR